MIEEPVLKKKKSKKNKYIFFSILSLFLVVGISYGLIFFVQQYESSTMGLNSDVLTVDITESGNVAVSNAVGQKDIDGINNARTTFTITNNSNVSIDAKISIVEETNSVISNDQVRFGVFENDTIRNINNLGETNNVIYVVRIDKGETKTIQSTIWLDYYYEGAGESFRGKYKVDAVNVDEYGSSYLTRLVDKDKGIIKVTDTDYRYNTATSSNYIKFNDEMWRIIGVINNKIEIVREDSLADSDVTSFYNGIIEFYQDFVDETVAPSLLTATDSYNATFITNTTNKVKLTLKEGIYIVGGNGTSALPYLLSSGVYEPLYYQIQEANETYLLDHDGDMQIIAGSSTDVLNNYVSYSDKVWRVIGINNDGSVKLITEDIITSFYHNEMDTSFENNKAYIWMNGEFFDSLKNANDLVVLDYLWNRTISSSPTTKSSKIATISAPVGLIEAYEYYMSYSTATNVTGYLKKDVSWLTITPSAISAVYYIDTSSNFAHFGSASSIGIRPVINLRKDVNIASGTGTVTDPFVIKVN